ncbi:ABC transporter ATP-binding protein [candidate division KSB1 bacterium]|nr:ABC transporter ATP-binding protein [candidate division KSB1 bacterium]
MDSLIQINNLHTHFHVKEGVIRAVNGVSLTIRKRRTIGLVGESGCGKSITARSILRILPTTASIVEGQILLYPNSETQQSKPIDLVQLNPQGKKIRDIRGKDISMIFQEPMTSLSPVHTVGNQIIEAILLHQRTTVKGARERAIEMLKLVGIPLPQRRIDEYPHELSGGLRQRCMIAMALSCNPRLLIADEPTTALDVTIQAQILELMLKLQQEFGMAIMMITHDLGVIAETAKEVAIMYMGTVVEFSDVDTIFYQPAHPYTEALLNSIPRIGQRGKRLESIKGVVPDAFAIPPGCPFHPRCSKVIADRCTAGAPPLMKEIRPGHFVACHALE